MGEMAPRSLECTFRGTSVSQKLGAWEKEGQSKTFAFVGSRLKSRWAERSNSKRSG